jgi:DNA helicase II / ATP-dependent DNA helicase PcrA
MDNSLNSQIEAMKKTLRAGQKELALWEGGEMAVSAVPGAGKSHSLSVAGAIAIVKNKLHSRRQLVIVTYTNSAAASIKTKIKERLTALGTPSGGFVVQTLHGLAFHIANSHPELSGLNRENTNLIIPTPSHRILRIAVEKWIIKDKKRYNILLEGAKKDKEETEKLCRQSALRTEALPKLAYEVIREAKSSGLSPEDLWKMSERSREKYQILAIAAGLFEEYQIQMKQNNYIDYDDMILGALEVLKNAKIRQIWQNQIFAVFEDEAQDSSPLQEKLIKILAQEPNEKQINLVRVGDPNQAINSSFTPSDPMYFNWFCETCNDQGKLATMDQAGRSSQIILDASNFMLNCAYNLCNISPQNNTHKSINKSPFRLQNIKVVDSNDPQADANPQPEGKGLEIYTPNDIYHTVNLIEKRVIELFKNNPHHSGAILVRENRQGYFLAQQLSHLTTEYGIKIYEVNQSDRNSHIPEEILKLLQFMERPHSPDLLKSALEVLENRQLIDAQDFNALASNPEIFLYPTAVDPPQKEIVKNARKYCCSLLKARLELPHYSLISFLSMTLQYKGAELATIQKLSEKINQQIIGKSSLKNIINTLNEIINSERFLAIEEDTENKYVRPKQITIITMHKSKGLDWDYVFVPFLQDDTLPGNPWVPNPLKFLGDFTLEEVARAQIRRVLHSQYLDANNEIPIPLPPEAWQEANQLKKAEAYRLLYVAMTRAKRLLWLSAEEKAPFSWGSFRGKENLQYKKPCPIIPLLKQNFPDSVIS